MLRRAGFFHFGAADRDDPVGALEKSLDELSQCHPLCECLVVTPEAFNIRGGYYSGNAPDFSIEQDLQNLSKARGVALVAGLIEKRRWFARGYSTAYLIDGTVKERLTRKMGEDKSGNYSPCKETCDTPLSHRGLCLASLICIDARENLSRDSRVQSLLEKIAAQKAPHAILCIPAHFQDHGQSEAVASASHWPSDVAVVVANSAGLVHASVIRLAGNVGGEPIRFADTRNAIRVALLDRETTRS